MARLGLHRGASGPSAKAGGPGAKRAANPAALPKLAGSPASARAYPMGGRAAPGGFPTPGHAPLMSFARAATGYPGARMGRHAPARPGVLFRRSAYLSFTLSATGFSCACPPRTCQEAEGPHCCRATFSAGWARGFPALAAGRALYVNLRRRLAARDRHAPASGRMRPGQFQQASARMPVAPGGRAAGPSVEQDARPGWARPPAAA